MPLLRNTFKAGLGYFPFLKTVWQYILRAQAYGNFLSDFLSFYRKSDGRFSIAWRDRYPCLQDRTAETGFDRHYIYHPAWAARVLAKTRPSLHIDISSTLHFSTIISAFIPVEFYDFRPADIHLDNFRSKSANLLNLPFSDNSVQSISCMHVIEHIGLGRYGDELNPKGDLTAMSELARVLAPDGSLLLVVPVGHPRVMFNAHRIYSFDQVVNSLRGLTLINFSLISERPEDGGMQECATVEQIEAQTYGCGCFWFKKGSLE